jgi:two-component system cell cycle sensor histidine kinase/response regulator CckA
MTIYDPETDGGKMPALIRLAASIAKQLNKVVISLAAEADMLAKSEADAHLQPTAALIRKAANQVEAIASCLFAFAGDRRGSPRLVSVANMLLDLTPLLRRILDPAIDLQLICGPDLPCVYVDVCQLEQTICMLVARARDAMPDAGAVTVTVSRGRQPGRIAFGQDCVQLEIADTGVHIPVEFLPRVFEPVLVRKGYGLWLGVATVYSAVRHMNGRMSVRSAAGQGTCFSILVPSWSP